MLKWENLSVTLKQWSLLILAVNFCSLSAFYNDGTEIIISLLMVKMVVYLAV